MSDGPMFTDWLSSTRELQEKSYGFDFDALVNAGEECADYVRWNVLAATDELHEALAETSWKPWGKEQGAINREELVGELVDALHFVANLLVLVGCTDTELSERYRAKQQVNRDRMASGSYTGTAEKCPHCHRDLLEAGTVTTPVGNGTWTDHCGGCGQFVRERRD